MTTEKVNRKLAWAIDLIKNWLNIGFYGKIVLNIENGLVTTIRKEETFKQ